MAKKRKQLIPQVVHKYPYSAKSDDNKKYLSDRIFRMAIKIRKKSIKKMKKLMLYAQLGLSVSNGLAPIQAIGTFPIITNTSPIIDLNSSTVSFSKKAIVDQILEEMPVEFDFTRAEIDQLYDLGIEWKNNSLSQDQLMVRVTQLKGGSYLDLIGALGLLAGIIHILNEWTSAFQSNNAMPQSQPHWGPSSVNLNPGNSFGYNNGKGSSATTGKGPTITSISGLTQNKGSEQGEPSSCPYEYIDVMKELDRQKNKRTVTIRIGDETYRFQNPYRDKAEELQFPLAEKIYESIRNCDTDISDIAEHLDCKANNIKKVKQHVFINEHYLDRYGPPEYKRFDGDLKQALAWKRLQSGTHTPDDRTWVFHEWVEQYYESKCSLNYNEAHDRAQNRFDGSPWGDDGEF